MGQTPSREPEKVIPVKHTSKETIYCLKLKKNNTYYVGKTNNVDRRMQEHKSGKGSEWTTRHGFDSLIETFPCTSDFDEDNYTKVYMRRYGIDKVRGGSYVTVTLPDYQLKALEKEIQSADNVCFKCGKPGHYVKNCAIKTAQTSCNVKGVKENTATLFPKGSCNKCGKDGHARKECKSRRDIKLDCSRCGRNGHAKETCYVKI